MAKVKISLNGKVIAVAEPVSEADINFSSSDFEEEKKECLFIGEPQYKVELLGVPLKGVIPDNVYLKFYFENDRDMHFDVQNIKKINTNQKTFYTWAHEDEKTRVYIEGKVLRLVDIGEKSVTVLINLHQLRYFDI